MIDHKMKVWLIEVNTNPCLEESSPILEEILPRMLDDAFRLTIDQLFPARGPYHKPVPDSFKKKIQILNEGVKIEALSGDIGPRKLIIGGETIEIPLTPDEELIWKSHFPVNKFSQYSDSENMWDHVVNIGRKRPETTAYQHLIPF